MSEPSPRGEEAGLERRLHPLSWVFSSARNLRGTLTALFFLLIAQQGAGSAPFFLLFLVPFLLFTGVVGPLLRYLTFRYTLYEDEMVIRKGVLSRNERRLAYGRIQNIDRVENPFHRLAGLAVVRIETASGGKPEATMHLSPAAIEELRSRVFRGRAQDRRSPSAATDATATAHAPHEAGAALGRHRLLVLGAPEIVRLGLIQNRGMVLVAAVIGLVFQQNLIDWERFGEWMEGRVREGTIPDVQVSPILIAAVLALVVVLWLVFLSALSIVFAFVRYAGFELSREGEDLRARFGLFTRVAMTVPRGRIQRVWSKQTLLHRLFGRLSIRLDTAGGGEGEGATGRHWLAPVTTPDRLPDLISEALPNLERTPLEREPGADGSPWQPVEHRAWKRLFRRWIVISLLPGAALAAVSPWGLLALPPLWVLFLFGARRSVEHRHYAITDDAILTRAGWLSRTLSIVRFEKIQAVSFRQSPFDRRHRMGSIHIDTAGASLGTAIDLDFVDESIGRRIAELLHREAARRSFRWG